MLKLNTIAVVVRDEKKSAKWYKEKLGFRVVDKYPHWHTVLPRGSSTKIHLCIDAPPESGNTGIAFATTSCKRDEAALRKKGVKITTPTTKEDWGTYFTFADQDGNEFWVVE